VQQAAVAGNGGKPDVKRVQETGVEVFEAQDLVEPTRQLAFVAHQPSVVELAVGQFIKGAAGERVKVREPFCLWVFGQFALGDAEQVVEVEAVTNEITSLPVRGARDDD
jgi:hypothetical protein